MTNEEIRTAEQIQAEIEENEKNRKKLNKSERSVKRYEFIVLRILILIAVIWVLFFKMIGLTHMPSGDMYPRIDAGDLVLFYRLDKEVKPQDVIVIEKTTPESGKQKEMFILRVVATEGDTVDISDGYRLIVNGNTMIESNIFYQTPPYDGYTEFPLTLGEGECFVLADQREGGSDSRYFGAVTKDEIQGTVINILRRNNI